MSKTEKMERLEEQNAKVRGRNDRMKDSRKKFLLAQTELFAHFLNSQPTKLTLSPKKKPSAGSSSTTTTSTTTTTAGPMSPTKGRRGRVTEEEEDQKMMETAEEEVSVTRLTTQPHCIAFGTMRDYQLEGLNWMINLHDNGISGILADEMGLGKTLQTISLLGYLKEARGVDGPHLVIVPKSTIGNWMNEFKRWCPSLRVFKMYGNKAERADIAARQFIAGNFDVVVTSYEMILIERAVFNKFEWEYIAIDEAHRIKNENSRLSEAVRFLNSHHRLLITGTPLQNNLQELWSLLNFLLPSVFGSSGTFEQWFNAPFEKTGESLELNEEETLLIINRLHKVLRPFLLRRLKSEVAKQLPSKVETVLKCDMSAMQKALYNRLKNREVVAAGGPRALNNVLIQLRKVCNHPYLFPDADSKVTNRNIIRACGKFDLLDNLLTKLRILGNRVLLFSQMTQLLTVLEDYLLYRGFAYIRLDGTTRNEDRGRLLKMYNAKDSPYFVFLLSTRAGGLGLNLQAADTVILFDSDWNPHADLQAQDRAHRIGQKTQVRIFRLITQNSVEEHILARALEKLEMDAMVIGAGKFNQKSSAEERREMLRQILAEDIGDRAPDDLPTSSEINQLIARSEAQFQLFERMDKEDEERRKLIAMRNPDDIEGFPPLMTEEEIPTWLKKETLIKEREARAREMEVSLGKGKRSRTEVIYNDGLSDDKFAELLDAGLTEAEIQQYVIQKRERAKKRKRRGRGGAADDDDDDHEEEEEDHDMMVLKRRSSRSRGSASAGPRAKKSRGLGRGLSRGRSGVEEEDEEEEEEDRSWHGQAKEVIAQLRELTAVDEEGYERRLMDPFEKLPSKTDYPDYYAYISDPRAFSQVTRKISRSKYPGYEAFVEDVRLIFANAMSYNREDSLIYQDASVLLGSFEDMKQQQ